MNCMGIDPGQSGGIAVIGTHRSPIHEAWKMPDTEAGVAALLYAATPIDFAMIEAVHSFPGQGVASSFKFGQGYGFLRGMLVAYGIPFEAVSPQRWQKFMSCMTRGDKNVSKRKAQELFTEIRVTHAIADALLIAEYCRRIKTA